MIRIEFEPATTSAPCPCCGGKTTALTRFVSKDDDAYAIYYARFSDNHPERVVAATISLGDWGEEAEPGDRVAFAVRIWVVGGSYQVGLVDAADSPWKDVEIIGRTLDRAEALAHPWVKEAFHITDHMVADDPEIHAYLDVEVV